MSCLSPLRRPLLAGLCVLTLLGCQDLRLFRMQSGDDDEKDALDRVTESEIAAGQRSMIGDYTNISGLKMVVLEGVGLVTQLNGTGGDSPTSSERKAMLDDMRKRRVKEPNKVLASPSTALVLVRAYLPPLIKKGETFDVEVRLPEGSEATSLAGGWLLKCDLVERAIVPGRGPMNGDLLARAEGPILISTGETSKESLAGVVRRGTIPGGAVSLRDDRPLTIHLKSDFRSVRMANRITKRIGDRFSSPDEYGIRRPLAKFVTDSRIELEMHPAYRENYPRYLEVIRSIAFNEKEVERHLRMQRLREDLRQGTTAFEASLQLEAIGREAVPILKDGLNAPTLEARFHAATALAYLGEADGVEVLFEAADQERALRVFALAAMTALESGEAHDQLTRLLDHESIETRYGAFRALTTLNPNDPAVNGRSMNDRFRLHVLPCDASPVIHITRRRKAEIVLFGQNQRLKPPLAANAGNHIWVTARAGEERVVVSRYEPGREDRRLEVSTDVEDVIAAVVEVGGTYPDVVQMLVQAERQHNLEGRIAIDKLPQAGRIFHRKGEDGAARVGNQNYAPNLFPSTDEEESEVDAEAAESAESAEAAVDRKTGSAPVVDSL
jgi:hypothetical protein